VGKGQVTLFILVGIVFLAAIWFVFTKTTMDYSSSKRLADLEIQSQQLRQTLASCIDTISYHELSRNVARLGGFFQDELNVGNSVKIADNFVAIWNLGNADKSPEINDIENRLSAILSEKIIKCFSEVYNNSLKIKNEQGDLLIKAAFFDDHFEVKLNGVLELDYLGNEFTIPEASSRFNYNIKKDFEIAKKILSEVLAAQPSYYDITLNCNNLRTNGKTNIYSIDIVATKDEHITVISIIDYEPIMRDKKDAFRINFALKDVKVMGFCAG